MLMQTHKRPAHLKIILLFIFLILLPFMLIEANRIINNTRLDIFAQQLIDIPIPPKSKVIRNFSRVGGYGNGHYCQFLAGIEIESELTLQEVKDYYYQNSDVKKNLKFHGPIFSRSYDSATYMINFYKEEKFDKLIIFEFSIGSQGHNGWLDTRC